MSRRGLCTMCANLRALYAWVIRWHVTDMSNHVCAYSVISMWHVNYLQHLATACSEQSRPTSVLPISHVIQMPQCLFFFLWIKIIVKLSKQGRLNMKNAESRQFLQPPISIIVPCAMSDLFWTFTKIRWSICPQCEETHITTGDQ